MPVVTAANSYLLSIHKQSNEATVGTVGDYSVPVYSATVGPVADVRRIAVTDGSSIEGDPYKGPSSWNAQAEFPAFAAPLGTFVQSLWPTDTKTGAGPTYNHAFSGLGGTQSWVALYSEWVNASNYEQTFGKGLCTGMTFSADAEGGPLKIGYSAIGQTVTKQANTVTTANTLTDGYYTLVGGSVKADFDTANTLPPGTTITNVKDVSVTVNRGVTPEPTADAATVTNLGQGLVTTNFTMTLLYDTFDAYAASYFGAVAGTSLSATLVKGALELNFVHSVAAWTFQLQIGSAVFFVGVPTPDPSGSALTLAVTGYATTPTSGSHVIPTIVNAVSAAY